MNKLVSVIIPTINRKEELIQTLASIIAQDYKDIEIIVIDNNSSDDTTKAIQEKFPQIKLIKNDRNLGASFARNQGILISKGKFLWFTDNDIICPNNNTLRNMVEFLENHPEFGAIGGELISGEGQSHQIKGFMISHTGTALPSFTTDEILECDYIDTLNLFTLKDIAVKLKGFDNRYFYLAEDKDFCFKIKKLNLKVAAYSKGVVHHLKSSKQRPNQFSYRYKLERNRLRFAVLNLSLFNIILLPFRDFIPFFNYRKFLIQGAPLFLTKFTSIFAAYIYNILVSPITLLDCLIKPDYLNLTKSKWNLKDF